MENIIIDKILSNGIHIDASDKQRTDVALKVEIRNLTATNTKNSFSSFIKVFENSELKIYDSHFESNFGLSKGSVVCGDYRRTKTEIFDSVFKNNAALEGGIFCVNDDSQVSCTNCEISKNFAVNGGIFVAETNGFIELKNSSIFENIAISIAIGEILDSVGLTKIESSNISSNSIVEVDYLELEVESCTDLCHIPSEYLKYYLEYS